MAKTANIHGTDRRNLTVVLPGLHALRARFGPRSPAGFRCSNIAEGLDNRITATGEQKAALEASIKEQMADLAKLTAGE